MEKTDDELLAELRNDESDESLIAELRGSSQTQSNGLPSKLLGRIRDAGRPLPAEYEPTRKGELRRKEREKFIRTADGDVVERPANVARGFAETHVAPFVEGALSTASFGLLEPGSGIGANPEQSGRSGGAKMLGTLAGAAVPYSLAMKAMQVPATAPLASQLASGAAGMLGGEALARGLKPMSPEEAMGLSATGALFGAVNPIIRALTKRPLTPKGEAVASEVATKEGGAFGRGIKTPQVADDFQPKPPEPQPATVESSVVSEAGIERLKQADDIGYALEGDGVTVGRLPKDTPVSPAKQAPGEMPDKIGLANAVQDDLRASGDWFGALPEKDQFTLVQGVSEARSTGMTADASAIARDILATKRSHTPVEGAAMADRQAQLINKSRKLGAEIDDAIGEGKDELVESLNNELLSVQSEIATISDAARVSGTAWGRSGVVRQMMISADDQYSVQNLIRQATIKKRGKLTTEEVSKYEAIAKENEVLVEKLRIAAEQEDARIAEHIRKMAEQQVAIEAKKTRIRGTADVSRTKIVERRNRIKQQLRDMGYRVNDITGVTAEGSYRVGQLALTYIEEGVVTLKELTQKIIADMPNLTERDVWDSLNAKNPKAIAKARTALEKRKAEFKTEARLMSQLDDAVKGVWRESGARRVETGSIRSLRKQLRNLKYETYRSGADGRKKDAILQRISNLRAQLDGFYRPVKEGKAIPTDELAAAQKEYADLKKLMNAGDELLNINEQLRTGDFVIKTRTKTPVSPELEKIQIELARARRKARMEIESQKPMVVSDYIDETGNLIRTMRATADMSGYRQVVFQALSHPIKTAKLSGRAAKSFFSETTAEQVDNTIVQRPTFHTAQKTGLQHIDLESSIGNSKNEFFQSRWAEKIPGYGKLVRASNRHMTSLGNLIRADLFDDFLAKNPNASEDALKAYADLLNISTGIGDLKKLGPAVKLASNVFFSPKLAASRFQTPYRMAKYAIKYPELRKQIARDVAGFVGTGATILGLAKIAGAEVSDDPTSPDFGQIRVGDTRVDIWGGFRPAARVTYRLMRSVVNSTDRSKVVENPIELIEAFAEFKLAPMVTMPNELITGRDMVGEQVTIPETLAWSVAPMFTKDIYEALRGDYHPAGAALSPLTFFGAGLSTYGDGETVTRKKIRELMDAGKRDEAADVMRKYNARNPDNKIVTIAPAGDK